MILSKREKELLVIKLALEGKSTIQIAEIVHISLKDIGTIKRRYTGEEEDEVETDKHLSINSKAFKLLKENNSLVDVAIAINMEAWEVLDRFNEYLQLSSKYKLMSMYRELGDDDIQLLEHLYKELNLHGLDNRNDISNIVQQGEKLKNLDIEIYEIPGIIGSLNFTKMQLDKDIKERMEILGHFKSILLAEDQSTTQR